MGTPAPDRRGGFLRSACLRGSEPVPSPPRKVSTPETPRSPPPAASLPQRGGRARGEWRGRPPRQTSGARLWSPWLPGASRARLTAQASGPSGSPVAPAWGLMLEPRERSGNERASSASPDARSSAPPKPTILGGSGGPSSGQDCAWRPGGRASCAGTSSKSGGAGPLAERAKALSRRCRLRWAE